MHINKFIAYKVHYSIKRYWLPHISAIKNSGNMEESLSIYGQMQFVDYNHLRISKLFSKLNHVDW
jgi:hypothetical protein